MARFSLSNFLLSDQYISIEHYSLDNQDAATILLIKKTKEELIITLKENFSNSINFPENWDKKLPIQVSVNTNQVIQKEVESTDASDEKLIHKAFPNMNWDDFYYEIWRLKNKSLVSICRKSYIENLLIAYQKLGIQITGLSLGVCVLSEILPYTKTDKLETSSQIISLSETSSIINHKDDYSSRSYEINGLKVKSDELIGFSGILRLILNKSNTSGNIIDYNSNLRDSFNQKSFFDKGFKILVGSLLLILFLNFLFFNYYFKKVESVNTQVSINQSSLDQIKASNTRIQLKEHKIKEFIDLSSSKSSQIINQITSIIPTSVLLSEMTFNPLEKKVKSEEPILTQEKTILISGSTTENSAFTNWIEQIQKLAAIKLVTIVNYGKDETNTTIFTVKIALK